MRQHARYRARIEAHFHDLQEIIECMNMKQKGLLATMERKQKLLSQAPEDLQGKLFQDVVVSDDRISVEEAEPFEKRRKWRSS